MLLTPVTLQGMLLPLLAPGTQPPASSTTSAWMAAPMGVGGSDVALSTSAPMHPSALQPDCPHSYCQHEPRQSDN